MWSPEHSVIHARRIAENLLTFFEANQVEALLWAHGSALRPFARIENSVGNLNEPVYPAIMFSDDVDQIDYAQDMPSGLYGVMFLVIVQHSNPATAVSHSMSYAKALASMARNCPDATLLEETGCIAAVLQEMEIGFDPIRPGKEGTATNDFGQFFTIRVNYSVTGAY